MKMKIIFDNAGGIQVQDDKYLGTYTDAAQAAEDVASIMRGNDPSDWEQSPEQDRISEDDIGNWENGYRVYVNESDIMEMAEMHRDDTLTGAGIAEQDFLETIAPLILYSK